MVKIDITEIEAGKRIKEYLKYDLKYSTGLVKKLKNRSDGILVNGIHQNVLYELKQGDVLTLAEEDREEDTCPYMIPVKLPIEIVYEDDNLIIVNKPPFMPAHPSFKHRDDTVANALAYIYQDKPFVFRPVNRLDRDTSGLMIMAKNRLSAIRMSENMVAHNIIKKYIALLPKAPIEKEGTITTYIKRKSDSIIERCVCDKDDDGAKIAITEYKVIKILDNGICACEVSPLTGRTHQIRVHFSHIGLPLLGDSMYGGDENYLNRQALHAYSLEFISPENLPISVKAKLPEDMEKIIGII